MGLARRRAETAFTRSADSSQKEAVFVVLQAMLRDVGARGIIDQWRAGIRELLARKRFCSDAAWTRTDTVENHPRTGDGSGEGRGELGSYERYGVEAVH